MAITDTSRQSWAGAKQRVPAVGDDFPAEDGLALVRFPWDQGASPGGVEALQSVPERLPWPSAVRRIGLLSLALWGIIAALVMLATA